MNPPSRIIAALVIALGTLPSSNSPAAPPDPRITRGPYLQLPTPTGVKIVWRTRSAGTPGLHFGTSPTELNQTVSSAAILTKQPPAEGPEDTPPHGLHSGPSETRQFEADLTGLRPDSLYYYSITQNGENLSPPGTDYSFRTLPSPGIARDGLFWVVGDSGTGNRVQLKVHSAMRAWLEKEKRTLDGFLHVGDMAYGSGLDSEFQGYFFESYAETLRNTTCWPALGNHEGRHSSGSTGIGPYFDAYICPTGAEAGGVASGTEAYYSFDFGKIHFICLNSHDLPRDPAGAMAQWLKADLDKTTADWLVAFWHHPPYTKGSHDSDKELQLVEMRSLIMPILESGGVDLVLTGHSHIYERSMLLDGAYATPTIAQNVILDDGDGQPEGDGAYLKSAGLHPNQGNIQVVAGHGGTTLSRKDAPSPVMRESIMEHGSVLIDFRGDTLHALMLNKDGEIRDSFQMIKKGTVTPQRIANPWQPPPFTGPRTVPLRGGSVINAAGKPKTASLDPAATPLVPTGSQWQYLAGKKPAPGWKDPGFTDPTWLSGPAGFGYGDNDDATVLTDMRGNYQSISIRHPFTLTGKEDPQLLKLKISYDDGFIVWLNGHEALRINVDSGSGEAARGISSHEANDKFDVFSLTIPAGILKPGTNVLSVEGHNENPGSSDFTLHPALYLEPQK